MSRRAVTIAVLVAVMTICGSSQRAPVAELTKADAARAAELYRRFAAAQADWESFKITIRDKYGPDLVKVLPSEDVSQISYPDHRQVLVPTGWFHGVEFSPDFRFVSGKLAEAAH